MVSSAHSIRVSIFITASTGKLGDVIVISEVIPALVKTLESDDDLIVRKAVEALPKLAVDSRLTNPLA